MVEITAIVCLDLVVRASMVRGLHGGSGDGGRCKWRDNNCTVEFDALGFSVKDFLTRHILLRCDSSEELYPVTSPSSTHHALLSVSPSTWHQRLEHRGEKVKEKQEKDKIGTKPDKNGKRGKAQQCRRPVTVEKAEKRRKYKVQGTNVDKPWKLYLTQERQWLKMQFT
nr:ribonuclease H-like domain-containing protein [Tanacetum cinerariifolium]